MRVLREPSPTSVLYTAAAIIFIGGGILSYIKSHQPILKKATCISHIKILAISQIIYAEDNDGCLPLCETWRDAVTVKRPSLANPYYCDQIKNRTPDQFGYAMYFKRSGRRLVDFEEAARTAILFESVVLDKNAATGLVGFGNRHESIPFAFADGNVKCLGYKGNKDLKQVIERNLTIP